MEKHRQVPIRSVWPLLLTLVLLVTFTAGAVDAKDVYLRADTFTKTMPDGATITLWGFVETDDTFAPLPGELAKVPGPTLTATGGEPLNIHVQNNLTGPYTEPTSIIINGQVPALTPGTWPTWTDGSKGPRTDPNQRVRSFTVETAVGETTTYTWNNVKAGTYLYQSGTHPGVQVQMGLYGALKVYSVAPVAPATNGQAYPDASSAFDSEVTLLFSEIDPALHEAIATGDYGPGKTMTSPAEYHPRYFLINGEPYWAGLPPLPAGNAGQRLLLRFLNAGLLEKTPTLQGLYMTLLAEDGNLFANSREEYSVLLPAGKTLDAILIPASAGYLPVYDRSLNLTNAASSPGGDRLYLQVMAADQFTLSVAKNGTGTGTVSAQSLPGGISCGSVCSQTYNAGTEIRLVATGVPGSLLTAWSGGGCTGLGDCIVTLNANTLVTATFTKFTALKILAPIAGEVIHAGSTYTVRWGAPANAVKFRVRYSLNGGTTWTTVADGITGNSYQWSVPTPASTKKNAMVRVAGFNSKGMLIGYVNSGKFTLSVP